MKNTLVIGDEKIKDVTVWVHFPKRRAPFSSFALLNLDHELDVRALSGPQAKVLLVLLGNPYQLSLKAIAQASGMPEACACRALKALVEKKLVVKVIRGHYQCSSFLLHYGRWNAPRKQHLQDQRESLETQPVPESQPRCQPASQTDNS